jgi:CheY-like chemotaxis protein
MATHHIEEAVFMADRAAILIRQLLAFSRRQPLRPMPLDVGKVVEDMEQLLHRVIGEDILLHIILQPEQQWVKADRGQLEQVIMNLVVNARDAMPNGGELFIKTYRVTLDEGRLDDSPEARAGAFVVLGVADTGQGIDQETRERIFEPFFTTKGPGEGTGLGLSTVYGIVRQHEGWISVHSEPGRGTSFKVYLPETSIPPEEKSRDAFSLQDLRGQGERILVVEDEDELREIATRMLRGKGYWVAEAPNVTEAVAIFEKEQGNFQLLFSDVILSDQSGLQLVEKLRKRKPELRVVLTSGYADQKVQWPIIQKENYPFLQKPYSLKDLLRTIAGVLKSGAS